MIVELSKDLMSYVMPIIDLLSCLLFFYIGAKLTKDFGFGSQREILLFVHRVLLLSCSVAYLYHALDIWVDPTRHGLTLSNLALHLSLNLLVIVSSVRITMSEHIVFTNGGAFAGPLKRVGQRRPQASTGL